MSPFGVVLLTLGVLTATAIVVMLICDRFVGRPKQILIHGMSEQDYCWREVSEGVRSGGKVIGFAVPAESALCNGCSHHGKECSPVPIGHLVVVPTKQVETAND